MTEEFNRQAEFNPEETAQFEASAAKAEAGYSLEFFHFCPKSQGQQPPKAARSNSA